MRKLFTSLVLLLLSVSVFGIAINTPSKVIIDDKEKTFQITLKNQFNETTQFEFNFFSPASYRISNVPSKLGPHESKNINITIKHADDLVGPTYSALFRITSTEFTVEKEVKLEFLDLKEVEFKEAIEEKKSVQEKKSTPTNNLSVGLIGLISFPVVSEMVLDAILILIAAILLIAFISRFVNRIQKNRFQYPAGAL